MFVGDEFIGLEMTMRTRRMIIDLAIEQKKRSNAVRWRRKKNLQVKRKTNVFWDAKKFLEWMGGCVNYKFVVQMFL